MQQLTNMHKQWLTKTDWNTQLIKQGNFVVFLGFELIRKKKSIIFNSDIFEWLFFFYPWNLTVSLISYLTYRVLWSVLLQFKMPIWRDLFTMDFLIPQYRKTHCHFNSYGFRKNKNIQKSNAIYGCLFDDEKLKNEI